jgi:hypothetical protein
MAKIWEVDFTSFSGVYPVDNIDNVPAVAVYGTVQQADPLPEFNLRPGIKLDPNATRDGYVFDRESAYIDCKGNYSGNYTTRSFVCWFRLYDLAGPTGVSTVTGLYCEGNAFSDGRTGLFLYKTSADNHRIRYYVNGSQRKEVPTFNVYEDTWHCAVLTVNKGTPVAKLYLDGNYFGETQYVPDNSYAAAGDLETLIGLPVNSYEPPVHLGYVATYSEELSHAAISGIYESFLVDSISGDDPPFTISGTVYDNRDYPVDSSPIYIIDTNSNTIVDHSITTSSGTYQSYIPYSGDFVLVSPNTPPAIGARAVTFSASGVAGSGTITFYDGS